MQVDDVHFQVFALQRGERLGEFGPCHAELGRMLRMLRIHFLLGVEPHTDSPVELARLRGQRVRFRRRIEVHAQPGQGMARQPMVLGGAVGQDALRREAFLKRRQQLEFAHHLDGPLLRPPPLQQRTQWLGLAGQPMLHGQMLEMPVQFHQRRGDGHAGEKVERRRLRSQQRRHEPAPESQRVHRMFKSLRHDVLAANLPAGRTLHNSPAARPPDAP